MMKKYGLFFMAFFFMFFVSKVNALSTCTNERTMELTSLAQNVNVDYEEYKIERGNDVYPDLNEGETLSEPGFNIRIYNVTKDLNIVIKSTKDKEEKIFTIKDANQDGVIVFDTGYPDEIKNYTITVRSDDYNCQDEVFRKISISTPAINNFYTYEICKENLDYYMCQEYTTTDYSNVSMEQFMNQIEEFAKNKEKQKNNESSFGYRLLMFMRRYAWLFITLIIMGVGVYVVIRIRNKQRSKMI